jgi:protein involved in polysaccharide export with SLBB domain
MTRSIVRNRGARWVWVWLTLIGGVMGWTGTAHAQFSNVSPEMWAQLTPEERQQLVNGYGMSDSAGDANQDQTLDDPQRVSPDYDAEQTDSAAGTALPKDDVGIPKRPQPGATATTDAAGPQAKAIEPLSSAVTGTDPLKPYAYPDLGRWRNDMPRPFGYELFQGVPNTFAPATDIPVPSDYVIGPGDNVRVQLFGNQNQTFTLLVSRDGTINFPKLGPIVTTGLRFDELQSMLEERVSSEMIGTTASVSLGRLRSIRVFVLGDVSRPGSYTVSSLSTMTHALFLSGGVSEVGSLRRVELKRAGKLVQTLDLYRFLLAGDSSRDLRLQPGDVVFVPPVGERVTVEGEVKRPAIYELEDEHTLGQVLELAGGRMASSDQTYVEIERIGRDAQRKVLNYDAGSAADLRTAVRDGDVVRVRRVARQIANEIRVAGYVKYPGTYSWAENRDLRTVLSQAGLKASDFQDEIYLPLGLVQRTDRLTGVRVFLDFNVARYMANENGTESFPLEPNDLVIIFSREDVRYINSFEVESTLQGNRLLAMQNCEALQELRSLVNSQRATRFLKALSSESLPRSIDSNRPRMECPDIFRDVPRALSALLDRGVGVYGEVRRPGLYPIASGADLALVLQAAAGPTAESDPQKVEYLSYASTVADGAARYQILDLRAPETAQMAIVSGDILNLRPIYLDQEVGSVRLMGEVRFPGVYGVIRGETLSQVIERAGGLTPNAYPYGAVFTRVSARQAEAASLKRAARDLQDAVVTAVSSGNLTGDSAATARFFEGVVQRLESAVPVGRVVVQADPAALRLRPDKDVVVEGGDVLMIPKRPTSVAVAGQVLNPGSQAFTSGMSAADYIRGAGGFAQAAAKKRAFIVFPDGSAKPLQLSSWNFTPQDVPPGSLIIVPRDAAPLNKLVLSERVMSIFSSLALSAAALVTISN